MGYRADDIAYADFFYSNGFIKDNKDTFYKYVDVIQDAGMAIYLEDRCYLLAKPTVRVNGNGFTHSDENPAIEWKDGSGIYMLNGVTFPKDLWQNVVSGTMPFKDILAIEDIDQRTQAMRYGDVDAFMEHVKGKILDTFTKTTPDKKQINYRLYEIPVEPSNTFTETAYFMTYDCPSTGKKYMSGVAEAKTVAEAMAWKFGLTQEQWKTLQPLVTES